MQPALPVPGKDPLPHADSTTAVPRMPGQEQVPRTYLPNKWRGCDARFRLESRQTQILVQAHCNPSLSTQERKARKNRWTKNTYPGIAGSEPRGLHGPPSDGAGRHHLGQDGPIAAFLIIAGMPVGGGGEDLNLHSWLWT